MLGTSRPLRIRTLGTVVAVALLSWTAVYAQSNASQAARPAPPPHVASAPEHHPEPVAHPEPHPEPIASPGHAEPGRTDSVIDTESHPSEASHSAEHNAPVSSSSSSTFHGSRHSSSSGSSSSDPSASRGRSVGLFNPRVMGPGAHPVNSRATQLPPSRLNDLNAARQKLPGINQHPLPAGNLTQLANGNYMLNTAGHRHYTLAPDGRLKSFNDLDSGLTFRGDGSLSRLHSPSLTFSRAPNGNRKVIWHPDPDTRVVSLGAHRGYVEHTIHLNGKAYLQRVSLNRKQTNTRTFVRYHANNTSLAYYPPRSFFPPGFYGWNYQPWATGVSWTWPWKNSPWYRNSGAYFLFAGLYTGPAPWLTDFILGETADEDAPDSANPQDALTPDAATYSSGPMSTTTDPDQLESQADAPITQPARAALVGEVRTDILQNGDIAADPTRAAEVLDIFNNLVPGYVLVVDDPLYANVIGANGASSSGFGGDSGDTCLLSPGDLISVTKRPIALRTGYGTSSSAISSISAWAELEVTASRKHDCPVQTRLRIAVERLQDMDNNFRARLDDGMAVLYDTNGKKGIPAAPPEATALLPVPNAALPAAVDASNAPQQISQAQTEATVIQQQVEASATANDIADSTSPAK